MAQPERLVFLVARPASPQCHGLKLPGTFMPHISDHFILYPTFSVLYSYQQYITLYLCINK